VKVLVTGATGFVGRHLVAALLARGASACGGAQRKHCAGMPWIKDVEFIAADIHAADVDVVA
jgi:dTDP-6-deoxy-L-talose 4-dehydrogenase (NAD+)